MAGTVADAIAGVIVGDGTATIAGMIVLKIRDRSEAQSLPLKSQRQLTLISQRLLLIPPVLKTAIAAGDADAGAVNAAEVDVTTIVRVASSGLLMQAVHSPLTLLMPLNQTWRRRVQAAMIREVMTMAVTEVGARITNDQKDQNRPHLSLHLQPQRLLKKAGGKG